MARNGGRRDSALRIAVGFVLMPASVLIAAPVWIQLALGVIAGLALVTGIVGHYPLFGLLGTSSMEPAVPSEKAAHRQAA